MKKIGIGFVLGIVVYWGMDSYIEKLRPSTDIGDTVAHVHTLPIIHQVDSAIVSMHGKTPEFQRKELLTAVRKMDTFHYAESDSLAKALPALPIKSIEVFNEAVIKADAFDKLKPEYVELVRNYNVVAKKYNDLLRIHEQMNADIKRRRRRRWRNIGIAVAGGLVAGLLLGKRR